MNMHWRRLGAIIGVCAFLGSCGNPASQQAASAKQYQQLTPVPPTLPATPVAAPAAEPALESAKPPTTPAPAPKQEAQPAPPKAEPPKPKPGPEWVAASENLLQNGGFNDASKKGVPYWQVPAKTAATLDSDSFEGTQSLRVDLTPEVNLALSQPVGVSAGQHYVLRGYVKTDALEGGARLEVQDHDNGFKAFCVYTDGVTGSAGWKPVSVAFDVPEGTKSLNVMLRRPTVEGSKSKTKGKAWFDCVELIPMAKPVGADLVQNGSFDQGENGLAFWQGVPKNVTPKQTKSGKAGAALEVAVDANTNLGIANVVTVKPGATYSLSAWVKSIDAVPGPRLEVQDGEGGYKKFVAYSDDISNTKDWTLLNLVFTVPEGTSSVAVMLRRIGDDKGKPGTISFDSYELYEIAAK